MSAFEKKAKNIIFRSVGFADWFVELKRYSTRNLRQNRSKNELVRENDVTRAHGSCSLRVMGSWYYMLLNKVWIKSRKPLVP